MYEAITRIIERYRGVSDTDYALFLNGEWGSGKTYYVEHDLKDSVVKGGGVLMYASLQGVTDIDQVNAQLMISQMDGVVGGEECRVAYWRCRFLEGLKVHSGFWSRVSHALCIGSFERRIRKANKVTKDATFIVIDDLERVFQRRSFRPTDTQRELRLGGDRSPCA